MRVIALVVLATLATLLPAPTAAGAQGRPSALAQTRVLALAPVADEAGFQYFLARWIAGRLNELLTREGVQVVSADRTEETLRAMGRRPSDLVSPTLTVELGRQVRADAVLTTRLLRADVDGARRPPPPAPADAVEEGPPEAIVVLDMRILSTETRLILLQSEAAGHGIGFFPLRQAADAALHDFVARAAGRR